MKRADLYHPRVFDTPDWAGKYYKHNCKNIQRVGKEIVRQLAKSGFSGGKVLDAGCGFGVVAIEIAKAFPEAEITAIDLAAPLLEIAIKDAEKSHVSDRITFQKGDVQNIEYDNASFDLVINTFLLHIVENPVAMLNELERTVKPEGKIIIIDLDRNWLGLFIKELRKALTKEEALAIINSSRLGKGIPSKGFYWWAWSRGLSGAH